MARAGAPDASGLERWAAVVAEHDPHALTRRLRWDGIDPGTAAGLFEPAPLGPQDPLPHWALTLAEITDGIARGVDPSRPPPVPCDEAEPIPFEHLLEPAVRVGVARLQALVPELSARLADAARRTLERALLKRVAAMTAHALQVEFAKNRPPGLALVGAFDDSAGAKTGSMHYERFVEQMASDGLLGFFCAYPVAGRLLGTAVDQWVAATAELLERLETDQPGCLVTEIETSLSDPHRGGRAVSVLAFADGRKLVYKPKSVALEAALNRFLEWCNQGGCHEKLRVVRVSDRGDYGWAEYVEHTPCPDLLAARRFYRRAGMLLCILHVLRATDCHHGNVVAAGEQPVLVDAETLFHPRPRPMESNGADTEPDSISEAFLGSVLRTLFLPAWHVSGDGQVAYDMSALGGAGGDPLPMTVPDWRWINTDAMVATHKIVTVPAEKNLVRIGEQVVEATDFEREIDAGFEEMWHDLARRRHELLGQTGPLAAMRDLPMRFLFRATRVYLGVLLSACAPEHLTSGARFGVELDHLARPFVACRTRPAAWPILEAELRALGQLDVPYFEGRVGSDALELADGTVLAHYFTRAGYDDAVARISGLDESELRWQRALIKGAFEARVARNERDAGSARESFRGRPPTPDEMRVEAERLADELDSRAIPDGQGGVNWLGLGMVAQTERVQLGLIGDGLYEGRCGVALFLAALHQVSGASRPREIALAALASTRRLALTIAREGPGSRETPGPAALGSMIYALTRIAGFLGETELLRDARALAEAMTPKAAAEDTTFDVLSGSAGAVLGLVSFHRATRAAAALESARAFGLHLIDHRVSHRGAPRAWRTIGDRPLTGFSHGAAGISYALLCLYEACGDERFRSAALEAIDYERSVFSPTDGNWPDLRDATATYPDQWCHGAAGIALARIGSRRVVGADEPIDSEIEVALGTTQRTGFKELDHPCCGNSGRIEALWTGAHAMGRSDWHDAALAYAGQMHARATHTGSYRLMPNLPCEVFNPGFFRGASGIGYQWLRLAAPELPSALLWE